MAAVIKMTTIETKLFFRETPTVFFTFAFPLIMLFIFASGVGGDADDVITVGDSVRSEIGMMVTGFIGMIIAITGLSAMPTTIAAYRERGILRRLGATPVHSSMIVGAQIGVQMIMTALGGVLLIVVGLLFYGLDLPAVPLNVVPAFILGGLSMFAVGYVIAALIPNLRAAQVVGQALFFPMIFLSGATIPRVSMPEALQRVGDFLPLTHVVNVAQDLWFDQTWNVTSLAVILGILVVGAAVGSRTFKWE